MLNSKPSAYRAFRAADERDLSRVRGGRKVEGREKADRRRIPDSTTSSPFAQLAPYQRCTCGKCRKCQENAKWDRIFAKFEVKEPDVRGMFQCALNDL